MSGPIQDRVLELLGRAPATYDGLRGSLGAQSAELDEAIRVLERSKHITRDRGRFHLVGADAPPPEVAEASREESSMAKKTCSSCGKDKAAGEFPKTGAQCKACLAIKAAARYQGAQKSAGKKPRKAAVAPARHIPGTFNGSGLMILQFEDGVRIGPITTTESGLAKMAHHVDLNAEQLEELIRWWKEARA